MNQRLRYTLKYFNYRLFAKHSKGHGVHSPFMFNLITKVFNNHNTDTNLVEIFKIYKKYKHSKEILNFIEIGAGSSFHVKQKKTIGRIIRRSSVDGKYGKLIYDLIKYFNPTNILELGTSVGISSAFIGCASQNANFCTIEGIKDKLKIAKRIASELNYNAKFICANFDDVLNDIIKKYDKLDFVLFDGNHTRDNTINYFKLCLNKIHHDSIFIFDDIHWSKGMEQAWNEIKNNDKVRVSVDLFRMGLIFFKKELSKQHYIIKF